MPVDQSFPGSSPVVDAKGNATNSWYQFFLSLFNATQLGQIPGTPFGDDASPGNVGEYIFSEVEQGSAVPLSSGIVSDIATISLTSGDWDVWAGIAITAVVTQGNAWINSSSASDPGAPNKGAYAQWGGVTIAIPVGMKRVSITQGVTETKYLSIYALFGGAVSAYGFIGARRAR